jgi:hypothetical protein
VFFVLRKFIIAALIACGVTGATVPALAQVIIVGHPGQPLPMFPGSCDTQGGNCTTADGSISCATGCTVTNDGLDPGWWEVDNASGSYLVDPDGNIYGAP